MTITQELAEILGDVDRPGDFFASGRAEFLAPRLEVEGVGPIALPLLPAQAKQLIKAATRAPYGRGADTVVDTKVRRTWQIEASRVSISGKHWAKTLDGIVERAAEGLGVSEPVDGRALQAARLRQGQLFRQPSRHREGARHVRDAGAGVAITVEGRRAGRAP